MKLQRQSSRKTKEKSYWSWSITLPNDIIEKLKWKKGLELEVSLKDNKILIQRKIA